ncbi:MAG TPA: hypothetical protein VFU36_15555 [Jatrophihabitans sp.]|nr:hypothetical protein [Jatrophihabitans sp.]
MSGNDDPTTDPRPGQDILDPAQYDTEGSDVGGPASALGSGVEAGLTGGDAESGDEGRASTQPRPSGD